MKKITIYLILMAFMPALMAQWQPVPITGSTADVSSMFTFSDDLMVGTLGDGIFKTTDNGSNWTNITGDLGNLFVNDIRGGAGPTVIWAATQNGAYYTVDHANYQSCTNPPLSNNDITYFWFGDSNSSFAEWAIGTNGAGVFLSSELTGPWTASNNGLSGDALIINDITGYSDDEVNVAVAATQGGVYISTDTMVNWTPKNNGLTGSAMQVNRVGVLGTVILAATNGGFYYSLDLGENWTAVIAGEKFNNMLVQPSGTGISIFGVGENVYYSPDFINFYQLNLAGLDGEVTCVAQNSTHVFLGTSIPSKENEMAGGLYRKPIDQLITGVADYSMQKSFAQLENNYPNPCKEYTEIAYTLEREGSVSFNLSDISGKVIKEISPGEEGKGKHSFHLTVSDLDPGLYFCTLQVDGIKIQTLKIIVQ